MSFAAEQQETSLDVNHTERQRNAVHAVLLVLLPMLRIADNDRLSLEQLPDCQHIGVVGMRKLNDRSFKTLSSLASDLTIVDATPQPEEIPAKHIVRKMVTMQEERVDKRGNCRSID